MSLATALAAAAGAVAGAGLAAAGWSFARGAAGRLWALMERALVLVDELVAPVRRADRAGARASSRDRTRLAISATLGGLTLGWALAGMVAGLIAAVASGSIVPRAIGWRARRYRRAIDEAAAATARALAGALAAGRSIRDSFGVAAREIEGPASRELASVAAELELGVPTDQALESLRERSRSQRIDLIVAAIVLQRRAGGNLAKLLRSIGATIEESDRLRDEARAASAQARFTSTIVLAMPVAALVLAELAAPGMVARVAGSSIGIWMVGVALGLQLAGALLVRRISRVEL